MEKIRATYLVESPLPIAQAAAVLAGEQSTGTFVAVPGETETLRSNHAAVVEHIHELEPTATPGLPGSRPPAGLYNRGVITVAWPAHNIGQNLPALISTLQGNLYELAQFSGLRLLDFDLPDSYTHTFPGPRHGADGTFSLCGRQHGPLLGNIIKPSIGLSPDQTAQLVGELATAGVDFIKDDELMANPPSSPFKDRVKAVMHRVNAWADETGKKLMVAFNISDDLDTMLHNYDYIVAHGGTAAMISLNSVGLSATRTVCRHGNLAIHGHRNGWGMLNRHPSLGMDFSAYQKIWRMAGVDHLHVNGIDNKFWEPNESVVHSIACCLQPFLGQVNGPLPVISSGQWGGQAFSTYRKTATTRLLYMAGGGIIAHPSGPASGVKAIRQAWEGAVAGLSAMETAAQHPEFRAAMETFSPS